MFITGHGTVPTTHLTLHRQHRQPRSFICAARCIIHFDNQSTRPGLDRCDTGWARVHYPLPAVRVLEVCTPIPHQYFRETLFTARGPRSSNCVLGPNISIRREVEDWTDARFQARKQVDCVCSPTPKSSAFSFKEITFSLDRDHRTHCGMGVPWRS